MTIIIEIGNFWHSFHPVYLYGFSMEQNCTLYPVMDLEKLNLVRVFDSVIGFTDLT